MTGMKVSYIHMYQDVSQVDWLSAHSDTAQQHSSSHRSPPKT
jgi:hypothetical protein